MTNAELINEIEKLGNVTDNWSVLRDILKEISKEKEIEKPEKKWKK